MNRPVRRAGTARRPRAGAGGTGSWEHAGRGRAAREHDGLNPSADRSRRGRATDGNGARVDPSAERRRPGRPTRGRKPDGAGEPQVPAPRRPAPRQAAEKPRRRLLRLRRPRRPVPSRYRRRRLVAGLTAALVLLVGVAVGSWVLLYDAGFADVEDIAITGLSTVPEQAVRDAVAVPPGGPLIAVDTAAVAERVAALEGVASVHVRRAWPHTVEVEVTERVPVALWQTPQGLFEVDGTGLPYRPAPEPPPALPRLTFTGVAPQDPSTTAALAVLHDLSEPLRAQVATVAVAGTQVTLGLGDKRSVRWGDPERSAEKNAVLGPLLGQPGTVYDVSSPDLPTVRP
jgi:cell division protein FtsQ